MDMACKLKTHMILTHIKMNVRPEKRKELRQTIRSIVQEVRKENGCVDSTFYQNAENENDFFLIEEWETQQALDDHLQSAGFTVLMGARSLLSRPAEIKIHSVSHSSPMAPGSHKT